MARKFEAGNKSITQLGFNLSTQKLWKVMSTLDAFELRTRFELGKRLMLGVSPGMLKLLTARRLDYNIDNNFRCTPTQENVLYPTLISHQCEVSDHRRGITFHWNRFQNWTNDPIRKIDSGSFEALHCWLSTNIYLKNHYFHYNGSARLR